MPTLLLANFFHNCKDGAFVRNKKNKKVRLKHYSTLLWSCYANLRF